jgi:nascent polypeptide-associated complex subunit alpha
MHGIDPRMMKQAMKKMGITQSDLNARKVIIELEDHNLVFDHPSVAKVDMMGETSFQVVGEYTEESHDSTPSITESDVQTVAEQAQVSPEKAKDALIAAKGDLAQAILSLKSS